MTAYKRADEVIKDPGTRACSCIIETKATTDRELISAHCSLIHFKLQMLL